MKKRSEIPFIFRFGYAFLAGMAITHWFFAPSLNWTNIPAGQWEAVSQIIGLIYGMTSFLCAMLLILLTTDD